MMPRLMGILNVTPDSFFDGGTLGSPADLRTRGRSMLAEGAEMLDVGGESTRPGATPVSTSEELRRVLPAVESLAEDLPGVLISIDTTKAEVARRALAAGARMVNDISALRFDPAMVDVVAESRCHVVLMHMRGTPATMQDRPTYDDAAAEVSAFLKERAVFAESRGVARDKIILDPGLGFGKTVAHNLELLRRLPEIAALGYPVMIGASRKAFIGRLLAPDDRPVDERTPRPPEDRLEGTLAVHLWAAQRGAAILRVHDVRATARALALQSALS
jgi:dihydropteroate synthase